jgi:hypothetical protein
MFKCATLAKAKIVKNKKLNTLRLIVAFNVFELTARGDYKFPPQSKCDFVSGDLNAEDVLAALKTAETVLRTDKIELV